MYPCRYAVSAGDSRRAPPVHGWGSSPPTERFQFPLRQEPPVVGVVRHPPHGRRRHEHERASGGCHVLRHAPFAPCPVIEGPRRPRGPLARSCEFSIHDSPSQHAHWGHVPWPPPNKLPITAIPAPKVSSGKAAQPNRGDENPSIITLHPYSMRPWTSAGSRLGVNTRRASRSSERCGVPRSRNASRPRS